ncbi:hypothetical protein MTQ13_14625 [Streptomyces sp. XM4011]|uniref:Uncharacterized protein n=2 Tax=Streptomyces TaxID=1883 RepID=A0A1I6QY84_9ACTN|nr:MULTISPECIES: hypothetical protein [Streptomyces]MCK1815496.1 hypothetical protein [Streptomyces sp. XM4011]QKV67717.1 hypothetical protein HUT13_02215 [Streptomyces harbinensis]SFS57439.1 hypothetical protein SAMN05444716_102467 [Streptomyces harbinensis]
MAEHGEQRPIGRRESTGTVGVIADAAGFARMCRYPSFRFTDHRGYLRHTERLLRTLAEEAGHVRVALFDPDGYAVWCARERLDADCAASRARYTAVDAARGATLPFTGRRPLRRLLPDLLVERERLRCWERATAQLTEAGGCPRCGAPLARCAFRRAAGMLPSLLAGPGGKRRHVVCTVLARGVPLSATLDALPEPTEPATLALCAVLAVALATGAPGGLVLRMTARGGRTEAMGWRLEAGEVVPLSEPEVFSAYCTDPLTGEPIPPEHGVHYRDARPLPTVLCDGL